MSPGGLKGCGRLTVQDDKTFWVGDSGLGLGYKQVANPNPRALRSAMKPALNRKVKSLTL